jgi:hypothetical protein
MKKFFSILWSIFLINNLSAQTGIGTTSPNASARLDVSATNKGFLPPRISLSDIYDQSTIPSPATGLMVYCKGDAGLAAGYYYWNGNAWATIATAGGSGSFAASFMRGSRTSNQTITVGGFVGFSSIDNNSGNDISLNTTDGKITLKAGNTYRLIGAVPNFSGSRPSFTWYNETTGVNIGSAVNGYSPSEAAANGSMGGIAQVIITPNVNTVVYLKLVSVSNSTTSGSIGTFGNGDFLSANGFPWFEAQVISGNAPITGQSVDYVQASLSANQSLSSASNLIFNVSSGAGITITNGGFNLVANKTYKLEASLGGAVTTSSGYAYYGWVDNTNTLLSGGSIGVIMKAGSTYSDAPQDKAVVYYTPSTNTTVYLRVLSVSGTVSAYAPNASSNYSSTWANITQIGSSAIINPWVLSGNDVYNTSGEVGIGTSSPSASAILDLTSSNKGFLPPRIALTASNSASPITSPTTGLLIYNTASAGSYPNQITPGYYFWNGTIWTRIGNNNILASNAVTLGAVTTNPTLGTRYADRTYAIDFGSQKKIYVQLGFSGGNIGSGDYLFSLPSGVTFNTSTDYNPTYTGVLWTPNIGSMSNYFIPIQGGIVQTGSWNFYGYVVPYSSTQYRILFPNNNVGGFSFFSSAWYTTNAQTTINFSFDIW